MNPAKPSPPSSSSSTIVTINVGGRLFQTTPETLSRSGPTSLLSTVSHSPDPNTIPFIDRDPDLFSSILSLLRTRCLPPIPDYLDLRDLIAESQFYGVEHLLVESVNNGSGFDPFVLQKSLSLPLNGRDCPSAVASKGDGAVYVAHGSKITTFDWSLTKKKTVLTEFCTVDSLMELLPGVVAAGATDFYGLLVVDTDNGSVRKRLVWENVTRSGSTVQAIGCSNACLFVSFESARRNSNVIVVYDRGNDLRPFLEIAHNEIYGAEIDSGVPATKLQWVSGFNLLMAAGFHSGPSGVTGSIKLWDVRSASVALEVKETMDCFSDVTVSNDLSAMFKVGVNSGEVFFMDLRNMRLENSWVCLGDSRKLIGVKKEGLGCRIESHGSHVIRSRGEDLELWSEVKLDSSTRMEDAFGDRVLKRNLIGGVKGLGESRITNMCFGGNKMFVTRKDQQFVEVWQNSRRGF